MKLSEQIQNKQIRLNIANECVQLMEEQVNAKKGITGVAFKTLYKGIKTIKSDYPVKAITGLLPSVSEAIEPIWAEGMQKGDPIKHLKDNQALTADKILSVTDLRIKKAQNKIVKASYSRIRNSLQDEIQQAVPGLADILNNHIAS